MVTLRGDVRVSASIIFGIGLVVGVLSGLLGVGGGFLLMPAMMYGLGVPAAIAIGTDILQITISGAFGAFVYARDGFVAIPVVATLLAGSALGARIGAGVSNIVDEDDIKGTSRRCYSPAASPSPPNASAPPTTSPSSTL